jgi:hypothetical protein
MSRRQLIIHSACVSWLALVGHHEAHAATDTPLPGELIARACTGNAGNVIGQVRLAEAILIEAGKSPSEFVVAAPAVIPEGMSLTEVYQQAMVARLGKIAAGEEPEPPEEAFLLQSTVETLEAALLRVKPGQDAPLTIEGERPQGAPFLFQAEKPDWTLRCKKADPGATFVQSFEDFDPPPGFAIRSTPEELSLTGKERRGAGALALGFDRTRSKLDDGTTKTETNVTISGTAGVRLSGEQSQSTSAYAYARYELKQGRTKPAPQLDPGASQSDGDTDTLETGLLLATQLTRNEDKFKLFLDLQGSAIWDFANEARRLRLKANLRPVPVGSLGLCGIGRYEALIPAIGLKTKCRLQFEVEGAKILRQGTTELGTYDTFLAAGGRVEFQAFLPTAEGMGFLAGATYRYLPVLHGPDDDVERFEASVKHRFWTKRSVGIDVGFSYTKGTNELSFEKEDVLTFGLGIIY